MESACLKMDTWCLQTQPWLISLRRAQGNRKKQHFTSDFTVSLCQKAVNCQTNAVNPYVCGYHYSACFKPRIQYAESLWPSRLLILNAPARLICSISHPKGTITKENIVGQEWVLNKKQLRIVVINHLTDLGLLHYVGLKNRNIFLKMFPLCYHFQMLTDFAYHKPFINRI